MGEVINIKDFSRLRQPRLSFESVPCPICDAAAEPVHLGGAVSYVCEGVGTVHAKLEWSHAPDQVRSGA